MGRAFAGRVAVENKKPESAHGANGPKAGGPARAQEPEPPDDDGRFGCFSDDTHLPRRES